MARGERTAPGRGVTRLEALDVGTRIFWIAAHLFGAFYILRCWRAERQRFYLLFATSWFLGSIYAAVRVALPANEIARWLASLIAAPGSALLGIAGFARLERYLRRRIATVRTRGSEVVVRTFDPEDERITVRPPARR